MNGTLYIGDRSYSSWSLRGWLLFEAFGLKVDLKLVDFMSAAVRDQLEAGPACTVPTWVGPSGEVVWDSLALAEELASRHPGAGHWPSDPDLRATARSLTAEMHSGFVTLRTDCPMNLRVAYQEMPISDALQADLARLERIWAYALAQSGGPWLCGAYSVADVFFAPVAARLAGYGLPMSKTAQAYVAQHLAEPCFRDWRAKGLTEGADLPWYARDYPQVDWPGPV